MKKIWQSLLNVSLIILIFGCGGEPTSNVNISSLGSQDLEVEKNIDVQSSYSSQVMNATNSQELYTIANEILKNNRVANVYVHYDTGNIDIIYKDGMLGGIAKSLENQNIKGSFRNITTSLPNETLSIKETRALNNIELQNKTVLSLALQYWDWGNNDDVPQITTMLEEDGNFQIQKSYQSKYNGNLELFTSLDQYGIILLSSHGDSYTYNGKDEIVIINTNTTFSPQIEQRYAAALKNGTIIRLSIGENTVYHITPKFIANKNQNFKNSVIYMSICKGAYNSSLANAFIDNGASVYLAYSDYVAVSFAKNQGTNLFTRLLSFDSDNTYNNIEQSFINGIKEYDDDPAEFKKFAETNLVAIKKNDYFETSHVTDQYYNTPPQNVFFPQGTWIGRGYQTLFDYNYPITLTIQNGSYDFAYDTCGGSLELRGQETDTITFLEHITYGSQCIQNYFTLRYVDENTVDYFSYYLDGRLAVTGTLYKQQVDSDSNSDTTTPGYYGDTREDLEGLEDLIPYLYD